MSASDFIFLPAAPNTHSASPRIGEILLSDSLGASHPQNYMTLAMLAHLSHEHKKPSQHSRWLTWICCQSVSKTALMQFDFDLEGLRILHPKNTDSFFNLFQLALKAGTSHTVVLHSHRFTASQMFCLEQAAIVGQSRGLVIGTL
jgi:cell division inhibitor SulA